MERPMSEAFDDQAPRRSNADQIVGGGRRSYRLTSVAPGPNDGEVGGNRRSGPTARSSWSARKIVGIEDLTCSEIFI